MQHHLDIPTLKESEVLIISDKEKFVGDLLGYCRQKNIKASAYTRCPDLNKDHYIIVVDMEDKNASMCAFGRNKVICVDNDFDNVKRIKEMYSMGANTVKPFRPKLVELAIDHLLENTRTALGVQNYVG